MKLHPTEASPASKATTQKPPTLRDARYTRSLERGLAILECFTSESPLLGIAEIADKLGISRSTTHRYAITLVALGFLDQDTSRKYRLGLRVNDLGMSALNSTGLRGHTRPYLDALRHRTSYTAGLSVLDRWEILYVERARSFRHGQYKLDLNLGPGSRLPAYCTAMGKVLLASLPEAEQRELIDETELVLRGPNTITSEKDLRVELEQVLENGMAANDEELVPGLVSIACPIRRKNREVVAAVNLAAHTSMISLEDMEIQFLPDLLATADSISARVKLRRDD